NYNAVPSLQMLITNSRNARVPSKDNDNEEKRDVLSAAREPPKIPYG
ncbi:hypothetical protein GWI33_010222, partial [Rhynchophorus ferrugineus]